MNNLGSSNVMLGLFIVLASLLVLIMILNPGAFKLVKDAFARTDFPGVVQVLGDPEIVIDDQSLSGVYEYKINFKAQLEYKGDFTPELGVQTSFIDVVPLISYKGREVKGLSGGPYFRIDESKVYNKAIDATIISKEPPIRNLDSSSYTGEMKKRQRFLMEDKGQFLIELESVESTVIEDFFCAEIPPGIGIGKRLCEPICWAFFRIECISKRGEIETKFGRLKGGCDTSECQKDVECGDGFVIINVISTDCGDDKAEIVLQVGGGKADGLGENIEISFWHKGDCVDEENSYENLRVKCDKDYLGGPYTFKVPLPE